MSPRTGSQIVEAWPDGSREAVQLVVDKDGNLDYRRRQPVPSLERLLLAASVHKRDHNGRTRPADELEAKKKGKAAAKRAA